MGATSNYKTRKRPMTMAQAVEDLLRGFQLDAEMVGDEAAKQRRRLLLRGVRVGLWAAVDKPAVRDVAQALRAELFGHSLPAVTDEDEDDVRCHSGADDEVMK
ncbi:hypothetical protein [Pseudomonas sp. CLCA07]